VVDWVDYVFLTSDYNSINLVNLFNAFVDYIKWLIRFGIAIYNLIQLNQPNQPFSKNTTPSPSTSKLIY